MASNSINFSVGFNVDKTSISQLKTSLQEIQRMTQNDLNLDTIGDFKQAVDDLEKVKQTAKEVEKALDKAFNKNLGTLNVSKFNQELSKLGLKNIYNQFNSIGSAGQAAFRNMTTEILTTNLQLKQSHKFLNEIATTMGNTIKWGAASSIMNSFTGSVQQAYGYVKALDSSLNDIRIVTGKSNEEMAEFARQANKAAQSLGQGTKDYTEASLIYYQQGLSDAEASARAETTLKAANVTGQSTAAVSEQLTAVWNGYKVSSQEAELYVDKLAAVAATTASDLEELSVGMSKVASAANAMGVDVDSLNAQLATIISVTRQAPESAGTALKTIYARMGDIEAGLDGEVTLDEYTSKMADMGVNVLNANGRLRDMGDVINEIGGNWKNLSREQQIALSQIMAGTRQYNNLLALFDGWDMYTDALNTSANAAGTLQQQQDIYMESTEAHLQQLGTAMEDIYDSMFNTESFNKLLDVITLAVNGLADFVDGIGGGGNALLALGSIATIVFSKQISGGINTAIYNFKTMKENSKQVQESMNLLKEFKSVLDTPGSDAMTKQIVALEEKIMSLKDVLNPEDFNKLQEYVQMVNREMQNIDTFASRQDKSGTAFGKMGAAIQKEDIDSQGQPMGVLTWTDIEKAGQVFRKLNQDIDATQISLDDFWGSITGKHPKFEAFENLAIVIDGMDTSINTIKTSLSQMTRSSFNFNGTEFRDALEVMLTSDFVDEDLKAKVNTTLNTLLQPDITDQTKDVASREMMSLVTSMFSQYKQHRDDIVNPLLDTFRGVGEQIQEEINQKIDAAPLQKFIDQLEIDRLVQFAGGVSQAVSGIYSLSNALKILENPNLEPMEKFAQIISSLVMGLPMLYNGLSIMLPMLDSFAKSIGFAGASLNKIFLAVTAGIVIFKAATQVYKYFFEAQERAAEATSKSIEEYQKEADALTDLKTKLEDVNNKLEELYSKEELSLTDQNEIANLEAESAELERQVELQERLAELKQQEIVANTKIEASEGAFDFEEKRYEATNYLTGQTVDVDLNNADEVDSKISQLGNQAKNARANGLNDWAEWYEEQQANLLKEYNSYINQLAETEAEYKVKLEALLTDPEGNEAEITKIKDWYAQYYETIGQMDEIALQALEKAGVSDLEGIQSKLQEKTPSGENGEWVEEDLKELGLSTEQIEIITAFVDTLGLSLDSVIEKFSQIGEISPETTEYASSKIAELMSADGVDVSRSGDIISSIVGDVSEDYDIGTIISAIENIDWSNVQQGKDFWANVEAEIRKAAKAAEDLNANTQFKADLVKHDIDLDEAETLKELLKDTNEEFKDNEKALNDTVVAQKRMQKAQQALNKNWDNWNKIMADSTSTMADYSDILPEIKDSVGDLLNLSDEQLELIPDEWLVDNWDMLSAALQGGEAEIEAFQNAAQAAAGEEILLQVDTLVDPDGNLLPEIAAINDFVANYDMSDVAIGVEMDPVQHAQLYSALNDIVVAAGWTADQATAELAKLGFDVKMKNVDPTTKTTSWKVENPILDEKASAEAGAPIFKGKETLTGENTTVFTGGTAIEVITPNGSFGGNVGTTSMPARTSGGGGKGGGGGGGGGGSKKPKKEKPIESKKDRYHDVNAQLSQIDEELEDIGRDQEKLFGKDLLNALNRELEVLEKQRDVLKEKLDIARDEQAELRAKLALEGVAFNEDGTITNYLTIVQQKEDELNALINQYNAMSAEEQETFMEEVLEPAQEAYEEFIQTMEDYDEVILETIPGIENDIQDALDREIELNIQKLNMEVELRLDLSEAQKDWSEFKRKVIDGIKDDNLFGNAKADTELFEDLLTNGTIEAGTNNINETIAEINKMNNGEESSIYGTDKQAAMENLEEQMKNLMGHLETLTDIQEEIHQSYLEAVDKVGEAFDAQIESYEYVGELIEHNLNLAKLIKGEDAYSDFDAIYDQQEQNNLSTLAAQKQAVDYYRQMMETEEDPEALEKWTEMWKESVSNLNSTVESSVELIIDKYSNTINMIFDEMDKALTDGKGLDYITLEWELINDNADAYLDTINAAYEVQKLERSVIESLNNTDSLYAQKKLNDFMEDELKMLREKEKLTQYDVDRANALYDIKLKEIALEEAQQNKSQMRLRRDSSGNYSYQFVADQDSISAAQQELDDAKNSLYNMDKDAYRENQQAILDAYTEYQEKMRDAANLSAEERELIEEQYNEKINGLLEENNVIRTNLGESAFSELAALYDSDEANFRDMSIEEQNIMLNEIIPHWDSSINTMIEKMAGEEGFSVVCREAMEQLDIATKEYDNSLKLIETTAGQTFDTLATNQSENIELARELAEAAQEVVNKAIDEKNAIDELKTVVDGLALSYEAVKTAAEGALTAAQNLMEFERKKAADEAEAERKRREEEEKNSGGQGSADTGGGGTPQETPDNSNLAEGVAASIWLHGSNTSGWGKGATRAQRFNEKGVAAAQDLLNKAELRGDTTLYKKWIGKQDELKKYYYKAFDTGGYTGEWGNEGKLAVLHEKELILNKDDTKNILAAVSLARTMESIISSLNDSLISRASGLTSGLVANPNLGNSGQQEIQQNVSIEANFPNVSSRTEIEDAFKNLVNVASQHAFNTQR